MAKAEPGPRERMIVSTALLVRERGARATSLDAVLEHSGAPRGSVYHHFPGGREQLLREATDYAGEYVARRLERTAAEDPLRRDRHPASTSTARASWRATSGPAARSWRWPSSPAEEGPDLRDHVVGAFDRWRQIFARGFAASGIDEARSDELALLVVSGFEGALILSRAYRDLAPLESMRREIRARVEAELARGMSDWAQTACILCECNCGIEVQLDGRRLERIRGDKAHPGSQGYTCNKAMRLDRYQNGPHRLTSPMRRRPDGSYEEIDWDTAIAEIAAGFKRIADEHGGESILYYGGGGQGNHLGGSYSGAFLRALGSRYRSSALAQEKTGEGWVEHSLYGSHTRGEFEHAEVSGVHRQEPVDVAELPARAGGAARDRQGPGAVDDRDRPRRHRHGQARRLPPARAAGHGRLVPGRDGRGAGAGGSGRPRVPRGARERRRGRPRALRARSTSRATPDHCGVDEALIRAAARRIAGAESVSVFEDLGIQQGPNSTLCSYVNRMLWILTGNFGNPGGMHLHTSFVNLFRDRTVRRTPVTGERILAGLVPCNVIPDEILTDHPKRFRAMIVESANPAHSLADSQRFREAFEALDLVLVIDVAMTETARQADYVLPAASQYEKAEATFFNFEFPDNTFHLRRPLLEPLPGTLPEAEIWARLVRGLGLVDDAELAPLREAAEESRQAYAEAFAKATTENPMLSRLAPYVLYETLGPTAARGPRERGRALGARPPLRDDLPGSGAPRGPRRRQRAVRRDPRLALRSHLHARRVRRRLRADRPPRQADRARAARDARRARRPSTTDPCVEPRTGCRSCCRWASAAPSRPTTSSATRAGASAMPTAPCG